MKRLNISGMTDLRFEILNKMNFLLSCDRSGVNINGHYNQLITIHTEEEESQKIKIIWDFLKLIRNPIHVYLSRYFFQMKRIRIILLILKNFIYQLRMH